MDMTLKANGFNFLNEINHNDRGNPHPQYIGVKERIKLPENNNGKFINFATFIKEGQYYSTVFEFELGILNHNEGASKIDCVFTFNKLSNTSTPSFFSKSQINMNSENIKAIVYRDDSNLVKIGFYIRATSDSEMYFKPKNTITYGSKLNHEYDFTVSVLDELPYGAECTCKNYLRYNANNIEVFGKLLPNGNVDIGDTTNPFSNIVGNIVRSYNGYIALGYGNDLTTIRREDNSTIIAVSNGSSFVDSFKLDMYGNIEILNSATGGIKMTSPNGTKYKITVNDSGILTTTRL